MITITAPRTAAAVVAIGCGLLVLRPLLTDSSAPAVPALAALFIALLLAGLAWPGTRSTAQRDTTVVLVVGGAAFAAARLLGGGHPPHAAVPQLLMLNSLAAVSEEAFFRRLLYRLLEPNGAAFAIAGSAALFALVHVTVYGAWILPIDFAAGAVLSWQRWASGTWRVPALTHVLANVLVVI